MDAVAHSLSSVRLRRALRAAYRLLANSAAAPLLRAPLVERGRRRMTATYVDLEDVTEILGALEAAEVRTWLAGGWACDALMGEQTRPHADIDLVIPDLAGPRAFELLKRRGFAIYERRPAGLLSSAVELIDRNRRRVALHLVDVDHRGHGDWARTLRAAAEAIGQDCQELFATGYLRGHAVPCVSAATQVVLHTGYPPGAEDRHNVRLLCQRFSLRLPPGYLLSGTTALLIPVPEAEPLFRRWSGARVGVPGLPPHVTILYPFMAESDLDAAGQLEIEQLAAAAEPFRYTLTHLDRFPSVLYAAPRPSEPFIELTRAVHERWPDYPPYGGAYPEITPHVTIALDDEPRGLAGAVRELLPIDAVARELQLLSFSDSSGWTLMRRFALGGSTRA